ncbi:MAG: nucleotide exchange factor GrpE [Planctomycetes bacterium]|nr:nucleotide exchange factor GrpE [Planctomycetota bacterium]
MTKSKKKAKKADEVRAKEAAQQAAGVASKLEAEETGEESSDVEQESVEMWRDKALRAQAEMANMRRRLESDTEDRTRRRMEALLSELITVADHMELALGSLPDGIKEAPGADAFLMGMNAIQFSLDSVMRQHGLEFIQPSADAAFDPELHEAVGANQSDEADAAGPHLELLRRGYKMGRRILRPAQVRVIAG